MYTIYMYMYVLYKDQKIKKYIKKGHSSFCFSSVFLQDESFARPSLHYFPVCTSPICQ